MKQNCKVERVIVAYNRDKNLRDILTSSKFIVSEDEQEASEYITPWMIADNPSHHSYAANFLDGTNANTTTFSAEV